jgi:hypothetical protein
MAGMDERRKTIPVIRLVNPAYRVRRGRAGQNPSGAEGGEHMAKHHGKHHYYRRRHNPDYTGAAVKALWGVAGGVATATIPDLFLGKQARGPMGYIAAGATALAAGWAGHQFFGASAGEGMLTGGLIAVAGMVIGDLTGKRLVSFSPLRGYAPLSFPLPTSTPGISYQLPASGAVTSPAPIKVTNGMGLYRGRSKFAA